MSLKDELDKLVEDYLKEKDDLEEDLEETSTTSGDPGYQTPRAFTGGKEENEKRRKKSATNSTGYKLVGERKMKHSDIIKKVLGLTEISYKEYKQDESMPDRKKVNVAIQEIGRKLYEIERTVSQNIKLKTETGIEAKKYWKATKNRLSKITERLVRIAGNIRELGL